MQHTNSNNLQSGGAGGGAVLEPVEDMAKELASLKAAGVLTEEEVAASKPIALGDT